MKKKLIASILISSTIVPSIGMISCSKGPWDNIKQQVLDEFRGLNRVPRPSGYHDKIIPYLIERINMLAPNEGEVQVDSANNILYDIEPTKGYEDKDTIIIQAHTDMIVAGLTQEEAEQKAIETVIEGDLLHSKNYKTSIGADNGIGVSIALFLLKHRHDFNHGRIRLLLTADEDAGMIGASQLNENWLKDPVTSDFIPWLINVDAEKLGTIYRSCCGNARLQYSMSIESEEINGNVYELNIDGLAGGHSAIDIAKNRANADKMSFEFLYNLLQLTLLTPGATLQVVQYNHEKTEGEQTKDIEYTANQIIANGRLIFTSSFDEETMQIVMSVMKEQWEQEFSEDWDTVWTKTTLTKLEQAPFDRAICATENVLPDKPMFNLIHLFGLQDLQGDVPDNSFHYGVLLWRDIETKTNPEVSCNIGPIKIERVTNNIFNLTAWTSTRSGVGGGSESLLSIDYLINLYKEYAARSVLTCTDGPKYYPWMFDGRNTLVKIMSAGYSQQGITPNPYDDPAGVEPAWWYSKSEGKTKCACLGPTIDGSHSVYETLHLDTIDPVVNNILYTIDQLMSE